MSLDESRIISRGEIQARALLSISEMATKLHYDILRSAYDEELDRCSELRNTAKIYLGVCTFLIGGLVFKFDDFIPSESKPSSASILLFCGFLLFVASGFLLASLGMFTYERLFDPQNVIAAYDEKEPTDDDFLDDRIADIVVASERNWKQNQIRAKLVHRGATALILGAAVAVCTVAVLRLQ